MVSSVFHVLGPGRGGTSLLSGLLDRHPACEVVLEALSRAHLVAPPPNAQCEPRDPLERLGARVTRFKASCEEHAKQCTAHFWGHKTPTEHILALSQPLGPIKDDYDWIEKKFGLLAFREIDFFVHALAGCNVIFVVRNGRSCVASKVQRTGQSYAEAARRWNYSVRVLQVLEANHETLHVLKFEELVAKPKVVLSQICGFLGIDYSPKMLGGTANPKLPAEYRQPHFDVRTLDKKDIPSSAVDDIAANLLYLGYPS